MQYIKNTLDFSVPTPAAISLGKFDGLHLGHDYLLRELKRGKGEGLTSVIFTFDVPPASWQGKDWQVLSTNEEKEAIFSQAGIDVVIECPFTPELRQMEPYVFLQWLTQKISVKRIVAGTDFRFGRNRSGSGEDLLRYQEELGYEAVIVEKIRHEGEDISSTRIRNLISTGRMEEANYLLGYPFFLRAPVLHGNEIGRTIGFPTANQIPEPQKLLPPHGVYVTRVIIDNQRYYGISNVGRKPTIAGAYPVGVETSIFDFHEQIYVQQLQVEFLHFLRPEQRFSSLEELTTQISRDEAEARAYFSKALVHEDR